VFFYWVVDTTHDATQRILIHPSAQMVNSAQFALTEFWEVGPRWWRAPPTIPVNVTYMT
jgi:hypothetical protein